MSYETLEVERAGPVRRIWLDRPDRRNAISVTMLREIGDVFHALETDFEARIAVLAGRGASFCAGMDRRPDPPSQPVQERGEREQRWLGQLGRRACRAIEECEIPVVARIQGHAIGGGFCFALACDFRIATRDALFRVPEVELGIPLTWGAVPRMIHEIGAARARELLLRCNDVDGSTAEHWGLVHRAVEVAELDAEVERWVNDLLDKPELAVHMTLTQLRAYARRASLGDVTESDGDLLARASASPEMQRRFAMKPRKA